MNRVLLLICLLLSPSLVSAEEFVLAFHRSPPYSDLSEIGRPIGMDMEISSAVAKKMGIELTTVSCPLIRCLLFMKEGEADLILGLIKTSERQAYMSFVRPPYYTIKPAFAFYKRSDSDITLDSYQDLQQFSIGVTRGAVYFGKFDYDSSLNKMETLSVDNQLNLLIKGRVDLIIGVESTLDYTIGVLGLSDQVSKVEYHAYVPISAYMAVSKKSRLIEKIASISQAIGELKESGELGLILKKYNIKDISFIEQNPTP